MPPTSYASPAKCDQREEVFHFFGGKSKSAFLLPSAHALDIRVGRSLGAFDPDTKFFLCERDHDTAEVLRQTCRQFNIDAHLVERYHGVESMPLGTVIGDPVDFFYKDLCGPFTLPILKWQAHEFLMNTHLFAPTLYMAFTYDIDERFRHLLASTHLDDCLSGEIWPMHIEPGVSDSFLPLVRKMMALQALTLPGQVAGRGGKAYLYKSSSHEMATLMFHVHVDSQVARFNLLTLESMLNMDLSSLSYETSRLPEREHISPATVVPTQMRIEDVPVPVSKPRVAGRPKKLGKSLPVNWERFHASVAEKGFSICALEREAAMANGSIHHAINRGANMSESSLRKIARVLGHRLPYFVLSS